MAEKRKDKKRRVLQTGESQRADGTYQYRYRQEPKGKWYYVYAPTLEELRIKEDNIKKAKADELKYREGIPDGTQ